MSLLALAYALEQPTPLTLGCWVLASGLTLATHYYGVLVIVPEALWLLAARRRQRSVQVAVGLVALCGLALIPLALGQNSTGNTKWIAPIPLGSRLGQVIPQFLVGFQTPAQSVLEPLAAALALGALVLLALRSDAPALRRAVALGAVAVGGLLLNLVLIAVGFDDLITRNLIALWVPAALVVAAGFGARWAGRLGVAGAVAMCAIGVTAAIGVATNRAFQRPDWRVVAHMLGSAPASGRVILIQHNRDLLPLSLYEHGLRFMGGSHARRHRARRGRDKRAARAPVLVGRGVQSVAIDAAALVSAARLSSGCGAGASCSSRCSACGPRGPCWSTGRSFRGRLRRRRFGATVS